MPKQHNALYGDDLHNPKGMTVDSHASSSKFVISASNMTITASGFTVKATAFQGDGSGLTGVPANDWDGTHSGNGVITGNLEVQGNSSGSISSTGSWGKVVASKFFGNGQNIVGVTAEWDGSHTGTATFTGNVTASGVVSASGGFVGDGSNLTGVSSFAGTAGTETLFSGSAASTGSFGRVKANDGLDVTGNITVTGTVDTIDIATRDAILTSTTTTAGAALPKAGGAMTGAITTNSTFDGVDIATRDGILTSTTTTAGAALPKAGGTMTGALIGTTATFTGDITAQNYIVSSSVTYMTTSFSSGSTIFGDTADDTHKFIGSITASGVVSASGGFVGDGSSLTSLPGPATLLSVGNVTQVNNPTVASASQWGGSYGYFSKTYDAASALVFGKGGGNQFGWPTASAHFPDVSNGFTKDNLSAGDLFTLRVISVTGGGGYLSIDNVTYDLKILSVHGNLIANGYGNWYSASIDSTYGDASTVMALDGGIGGTTGGYELKAEATKLAVTDRDFLTYNNTTSAWEPQRNISGSSSSTGSFGKVLGDGSSLTGLSSFAGSAGTETVFSGSSSSTGSFAKIHIADAEFLSMDHAAVRGDDDIEFIGSTTTGSVAGMISGLQEDDLILYAYAGSSSVPSATQFASEGYTSLGATNIYDYYYGHVWYKKMGATVDASVPNNPFYWGDFIATAWRNVHPDDLWDASVQSYGGSNNRPNTPSITTVTAKAVVVSIGMCSNANFTAGPSGYVGFVSSSASGFAYPGNIGVAYKEIATGASEDPGEFTSDVGNHLGYTIALKKYPAGTYTTNYGFSDIWNQHHKGTYTLVSGSSDSSFSGGTATFNTFAGDGSGLTNLDLSSADGFDYTSGSSPVVTTNPSSVGSTWINSTSGEMFVATDITSGENVWQGTAGTTVEPAPSFLGSRGLWAGGLYAASYTSYSNVIDYVTIATTGNAVDFGDLLSARLSPAASSNGVRGVIGGGKPGESYTNVIDYVTIATTGNAVDFGDLTVARGDLGSCSDGTKGLWGGGYQNGNNVIDYVTIASTGNATDFGDLTVSRYGTSACSDGTKGLWGGGIYNTSGANVIDYVTIASTGNATDFGDLIAGNDSPAACSDGTKGLWGGGYVGGARSNVIQYVTIASTGNATDFGDLTVTRSSLGSCSGT